MDEIEIIKHIMQLFKKSGAKLHDFYDDVSFISKDGGFYTFKVDMLVEGTDVPPQMTPRQIARKSVVSCISDLVAKGSKPEVFMISLGIPKDKSDEWVGNLLIGFLDASKEFDIKLIGGDVNEVKELVIDCFMLGSARRKIERRGALIGDLVATTPKFGLSKLGLMHLLNGKPLPEKFAKDAIEAVLMPKPPLECMEIIEVVANSSMDSSDGLAITLNDIATQSKKRIVIENLPAPEGFVEAVESFGYDAEDLVFYGGEEFQPVFTFREEVLDEVLKLSHRKGVELTIIGKVEKGAGVFLKGRKGLKRIKESGWKHLTRE